MRTRGGQRVLEQQLTTEEYGMALRKDTPELTKAVNGALAKLKARRHLRADREEVVQQHHGSSQPLNKKTRERIGWNSISPPLSRGGATCFRVLVTVEITAVALVLGCIMGLLVGIGRLNPARRVVYALCTSYVAAIRGTPLLVQLFILFFGLPQFGIMLPAFVCGVIGLGIYSGAYVFGRSCAAPSSPSTRARWRPRALSACLTARPCATSSCRRRWCV